jgi:uncharacterized protein
MKMSGERVIPAPQARVWEALNDPDVLRQSVPGCQEMVKHSPTAFSAKVQAKVGPVKANFSGDVTLSDLDPPNSYRISGKGTGGAAGFAEGGADVRLEDVGGQTKLVYDVDAKVGGKLAQIGSRLIDSTARRMADDFFNRFAEAVTNGEPQPEAKPEFPSAVEPAEAPRRSPGTRQGGAGEEVSGQKAKKRPPRSPPASARSPNRRRSSPASPRRRPRSCPRPPSPPRSRRARGAASGAPATAGHAEQHIGQQHLVDRHRRHRRPAGHPRAGQRVESTRPAASQSS